MRGWLPLRPASARCPAMTAPTPQMLASIRTDLSDQRQALLGSAERLTREDAELLANFGPGAAGRTSEGDGEIATVERATVALLGEATASALGEIDAALARIDAGTFGVCTGCSGAIPAARLEVRPRAALCVPCASRR